MRCGNTVLYVHLRKLYQNWGEFSSTALIMSNILHKKFLEPSQSRKMTLITGLFSQENIKNYITKSHFMKFYATKNLRLRV